MIALAGLPPGPPGYRFVHWLRDPLGFMDWVGQRYGSVFTFKLPTGPCVFVSGEQAFETLITNRQMALPGDTELRELLGDRAVLLLSGREHRERRRILMPPFAGGAMHAWAESIRTMTARCTAEAHETAAGKPINVRDLMQTITLNVMLQIVFGSDEGLQRQQLRQDISDRMLLSARFGAVLALWATKLQSRHWPAWRRVLECQERCDRAFYAEIEAARYTPRGDTPTVLQILLDATDEDGNPLPDLDIRDELMTMMVAGHENTATSLTWAIHWMNFHPEVVARIREEIDGLGPNPDPLAIAKLPYLEAVCNETLRIYPPVMTSMCRVPQEDIELGGHVIPAGTMVRGSIYSTHRDPALYYQPDRFNPDRFVGRSPSKFGFLPFGGGGRRCVGAGFAIFEMKLILAELARRWIMDVPNKPLRATRRTGLLAADPSFAMQLQHRPRPVFVPEPVIKQPECVV